MSEAWYAAFGLLALLGVANTVLLVAVMRQVGVLHQRVPPTGPGSVGPRPGTSFERLVPLADAGMAAQTGGAMTVLAYVTPGCELCQRIPGFLEAYEATAPPEAKRLISFVVVTDASEKDADRFRREHSLSWPLVRNPDVKAHYMLSEVGAPYLLALADTDGDRTKQRLLSGGIVNTLEQLEDLVAIALQRQAEAPSTPKDSPDTGSPQARATEKPGNDPLPVIGGNTDGKP